MSKHIALVLLCPNELAVHIQELWIKNELKNSENQALLLLPLPLPESVGEFVKAAIALVPKDVLTAALKFDPSAGVGVNPTILKALFGCPALFDPALASYSLISIVENPSRKHGYPNCDIVGAVSHGTIDPGEQKFACAHRETLEEACIQLPPLDSDSWGEQLIPDQEIKMNALVFRGAWKMTEKLVTVIFRCIPNTDWCAVLNEVSSKGEIRKFISLRSVASLVDTRFQFSLVHFCIRSSCTFMI
jgi:hypothetical protein